MIGRRFVRLTVIGPAPRQGKEKRKAWLCQCECGTRKIVIEKSLVSANVMSCGCLHREGRPKIHGFRSTKKPANKTYEIWKAMRQRCDNANNKDYPSYGGRGIRYDSRWVDFLVFLEEMGEKPDGLMLERMDNNGPYCKWNCKWATPSEQARNKRGAQLVTVDGLTRHLAEWSEIMGVKYHTLYSRLERTGKITIH